MRITIKHPYQNGQANWLKGNLHTHTTVSDGPYTPQRTVEEYARRGYDFLMLSDHDAFTDPSELDDCGMVLVPGNEITILAPHVLHVGASSRLEPAPDRQANLDAIRAEGGLSIVCHPNWLEDFCHCRQEELEQWVGYAGIEIYNGVVRRVPGSALATDRWDRLLGKGRKVWGFANDDAHEAQDVQLGWNCIQTDQRSPEALIEAMRQGRFYASTGVVINEIHVEDKTILVGAENAESIGVYSDFGAREFTADGGTLTYAVPEDAPMRYIRVECWGHGETMAWTQPFFIERTE
ncbi:MAG TPA: CehA/McbA family metallohydrolase [Candidatus Hydrogenedentes bacterium]|nr:CehA/McbA family metallohydrolase [Candidatus Hydrogenedentota bacterium]HIJ73235.1 CehA/McbA family metallohydrolase [Candidatus Hydrogenedentota bacterium]